MEEKKPNDFILQCFKETRRLCVQIAQLLQASEKMMKKHNWLNAMLGTGNHNTALMDMSYSVQNPSQWIPVFAFRFFKKSGQNRLAFISVLTDDHFDKEYTIEQALITAGFLDYGNEQVKNNWEWWFARYYGHLARLHKLEPLQPAFQFENAELPKPIRGEYVYGKIFAVPLSAITDEKTLETKVVNELINSLRT